MTGHIILRTLVKLLLPVMILFALYVQLHGDFGPGGGFQAGVIAAAAVILYALIFGLDRARRVAPPPVVEALIPIGVLLFAGVGVIGMALGGNFLDYFVLDSHNPAQGQHVGILLVELGVLITVASVMLAIFYTFAGRGR